MTSFTRIVIVLSLLRQALGLQSSPPNQVIIGLSLFLTFFVMSPTLEKIHEQAYQPYTNQQISFEVAVDKGSQPLREFMLRQVRDNDLALFAKLAKVPGDIKADQTPMRILIPAFVLSELKSAALRAGIANIGVSPVSLGGDLPAGLLDLKPAPNLATGDPGNR